MKRGNWGVIFLKGGKIGKHIPLRIEGSLLKRWVLIRKGELDERSVGTLEKKKKKKGSCPHIGEMEKNDRGLDPTFRVQKDMLMIKKNNWRVCKKESGNSGEYSEGKTCWERQLEMKKNWDIVSCLSNRSWEKRGGKGGKKVKWLKLPTVTWGKLKEEKGGNWRGTKKYKESL